jgi:hypothetical protein
MGTIVTAALNGHRTSSAEGLGGALVILGGKRGAQPHVAPQIARMRGIGQEVVHKWCEVKASFLVRLQQLEAIGCGTPHVNIGRVQSQPVCNVPRRDIGGICERLEEPQSYAKVDQVPWQ